MFVQRQFNELILLSLSSCCKKYTGYKEKRGVLPLCLAELMFVSGVGWR